MRFFSIAVCWTLVGAGTVEGALIPFVDRNQFDVFTTEGVGLANANGINFTSASTCPSNTSTSNNPACVPNPGTYSDYSSSGSGVTSVTLNFPNTAGFTIQGFTNSASGSQARLILYSPNYSYNSAARGVVKYNEAVLTTRNTFDVTGTTNSTSSIKMRMNLPTGTNSFALDLSNGCNIRGSGSDASYLAPNPCDSGDNHLGTLRVTVGYANSTTETLPVITTTDTPNVGDWNFVGAWSDTQNIIWVEVTLPSGNVGSIYATRFAYGFAEAPVPEGSTFTLVGLGLLAAGLIRRRRTTAS